LLAAPEEPEAALGITTYQLERVLDLAQSSYDFVLLDVERMLDPLSILALDKAQAIYLVTENMIPHARDAKRLVRILRALGYGDDKLRLVVNKADRRGGIAIEQLEKAVGLKVTHQVRDSEADVAEAVNTGSPLVDLHPNNTVARELRHIARQLAEGHAAERGWFGRLIGQEA
jgi:pilus assembly protein CpaE